MTCIIYTGKPNSEFKPGDIGLLSYTYEDDSMYVIWQNGTSTIIKNNDDLFLKVEDEDLVRVLIVRPDEEPVTAFLPSNYEGKMRVIHAIIGDSTDKFYYKGMTIWLYDNSIAEYPKNRYYNDNVDGYEGWLHGTFIVTNQNKSDLSPEQIRYFKKEFAFKNSKK